MGRFLSNSSQNSALEELIALAHEDILSAHRQFLKAMGTIAKLKALGLGASTSLETPRKPVRALVRQSRHLRPVLEKKPCRVQKTQLKPVPRRKELKQTRLELEQ